MTREEAIMELNRFSGTTQLKLSANFWTALEMAIKALEQDSILDKIKSEIKALNPEPTAYDVVDGNPIKDAVWETLADALKIIDKYKVEMENEE